MVLILAFFNSAGLFVLLGAEFLAMILVVVYVGAVAVLFLFVVMMLDIDFAELRSGFMRYLPIGALIGFVLLAELVLVFGHWVIAPGVAGAAGGAACRPPRRAMTNTRALGDLLYTRYVFAFQTAGMILLVAMIGAIVLTLRAAGRGAAPAHRRAAGAHPRRGGRDRQGAAGAAREPRPEPGE